MLIYISHAHADFKLFKSLRDRCEAKGFTIVAREKPFELREMLTEKGKRRIELANVAIIILTAYGRASYRVFMETDFISGIHKDHFVLQGFGRTVDTVRKTFEHHSSFASVKNYTATLDALEKILHEFSLELKPDEFNFIYHTDIVY